MASLTDRAQRAGARLKTGAIHAALKAENNTAVHGAIRSSATGEVTYDLDNKVRRQRLITENSLGVTVETESAYTLDQSERFGFNWALAALAIICRGNAKIVFNKAEYKWNSVNREVAVALLNAFGGKVPPESEFPSKVSSSWALPKERHKEFLEKIREWYLPKPPKPKPQGET